MQGTKTQTEITDPPTKTLSIWHSPTSEQSNQVDVHSKEMPSGQATFYSATSCALSITFRASHKTTAFPLTNR